MENNNYLGKTLSNDDGIDLDGNATTINPSGTGELNPVNKAYTDAADLVLQTQITATQLDLDGFDDELKNLSTSEVQQLQNIGSETISNTQWSYLGGLDQAMTTLSDVDFNSVAVGGVEMKTGAVGEDVVFQTTDAANRFRINQQGDSRYYNDSNIRTFGQDEGVLSGYDIDGDSLWNWFTNTPGLDSDSILQTKSKNGLYVPFEIKRNGETLTKNSSDVFTLKTSQNGLILYDQDGDLSMSLFADTNGSGTESLLQTTNKAGTATTFDINRNGSLIQRDSSGTQKFKSDTVTGIFTSDNFSTNSMEMKNGTAAEDVIFQTTDSANRLRINKQGDLRYYNDSNLRTFGQDETVLTGYDIAGDESWNLYTNTPGLDSDIVFQSMNKANNVATFEINRNGSLISREPVSGTQKFKLDTTTGTFITDEIRLPTGSGFDTAINNTGACFRSATSGATCLLNVFDTGSTFESNAGARLLDVNSAGATVPSAGDFVITGETSLKTLDLAVDVIDSNLTTTTGIATTNQTNISNNTSAISGKLTGSQTSGVTYVGVPIASMTNGVSIPCGTTYPGSGAGSNVLIRGATSGPFTATSDNVAIGAFSGGNNMGSRNVVLGYGHSIAGGVSELNDSVMIGHGLTSNCVTNSKVTMVGRNQTTTGNESVIIGTENTNASDESVIIGFSSDILAAGTRNIAIGTNCTIGTGTDVNDMINIGNASTVTDGAVNVGTGSSINGNSCSVGNSTFIINGGSPVDQAFCFGNAITNTAANSFVLGNTITNSTPGLIFKSIFETAASGSTAVFESIAGGLVKLGSVVSSRRYKKDINPIHIDYNTEDIFKIEPKSFVYKDKSNKEVGVIAEDYVDCGSKLLESLVIWGSDEDVPESEPRNAQGQVVKSFKYNSLIIPVIAELKKEREARLKLEESYKMLKDEFVRLSAKVASIARDP